jgi:hypothetical protein
LQISIDLHGRDGRKGVYMKEVDPIRNPGVNKHPLGIVFDQLGGCSP